MALRGERLREHILAAAKDVFLEVGFERASMDVIAARAETSKRTLYAHFESKERLFLAVIELVRGLYLGNLKTPADYPGDPVAALTSFGNRFLKALSYASCIRMCRVLMAEADRFPKGAAEYYDVVFGSAHDRLSAYLAETFDLSPAASGEAAQRLLGEIMHPRFERTLFGLDPPLASLGDESVGDDFDLEPVRRAVARLVDSLN